MRPSDVRSESEWRLPTPLNVAPGIEVAHGEIPFVFLIIDCDGFVPNLTVSPKDGGFRASVRRCVSIINVEATTGWDH